MWCWWGHQRGHAHQPDVTRFWHLILVLFKVLPSWSQFTRNPVHSAHFPLQEKKLWGQRLINRKSDCTGQEEDWNLLQLPNRFLSSTRFGITNSAMWADFTRFQSGTCLILMLRLMPVYWPSEFPDRHWLAKLFFWFEKGFHIQYLRHSDLKQLSKANVC